MGRKFEPGHGYRSYIAGKLRFIVDITVFSLLFVMYVVALLALELLHGGRSGASLLVRLMTPGGLNGPLPEASSGTVESGAANDVNVEN